MKVENYSANITKDRGAQISAFNNINPPPSKRVDKNKS